MKTLTFLLTLALVLTGVTSNATVRELWRIGLTNGGFNVTYTASASAMDTNGNITVAGVRGENGYQSLFVAAFDSNGTSLWELNDAVEFRVYVDAINLTPDGGVIVIHRAYNGGSVPPYSISSISKISSGVRVWQRTEPNPAYGFSSSDAPVSKLKVDAIGNVFIFNIEPTEDPPGQYAPVSLAKIDVTGHETWRSRLPFIDIGTYRMPMPMALTASGQLIVGGVFADGIVGAVASVGAMTGRRQWIRRPRGIIDNYVAVAAGSKSICLAGERGYEVYTSNGRRIARRRDDRFPANQIELSRDGGFMLLSPVHANTATVIDARGRIKWRQTVPFGPAIGFFNNAEERYLAVGTYQSDGTALQFIQLNGRGEQTSSETLEGFGGVAWTLRGTQALLAPDGTVRVILNYRGFGARFKMLAFEVEP